MGTEVSVSLVCTDEQMAQNIASSMFQMIHNYELRFSRFLEESELSLLNKQGTAVVSDEFMQVLTRSLELNKFTKNVFNPLVQVSRLGYTTTFTKIKGTLREQDTDVYSTATGRVQIDKDVNRIRIGKDQQLDFGGMLKGYLSTKLADVVMETYGEKCAGLVINLGGDLTTRGYDEFQRAFIFQLYNPVSDKETSVTLTNTALATSGTYARTWQTKEGSVNHIVDARVQRNPVSGVVSASIIHTDGAVCEAVAKLFLIQGVEKAQEIAPSSNYQFFAVLQNGKEVTNIT